MAFGERLTIHPQESKVLNMALEYPPTIITDISTVEVLRRTFPPQKSYFNVISWKEDTRDLIHVRLVSESCSISIDGISRLKHVRDELDHLIQMCEETTPND
jgi:hypothetical protein